MSNSSIALLGRSNVVQTVRIATIVIYDKNSIKKLVFNAAELFAGAIRASSQGLPSKPGTGLGCEWVVCVRSCKRCALDARLMYMFSRLGKEVDVGFSGVVSRISNFWPVAHAWVCSFGVAKG